MIYEFKPRQDLHGYAKPWPAGGGANQWDEVWESGRLSSETGANSPSNLHIRSKNYIPVLPETSYYNVGYTLNVFQYGSDKTFLRNSNVSAGVFTTGEDCYFIRFFRTATSYNNDIAINYPSTVTTYSPYENDCPITGYDITGIGTIYGGTLDSNTGKVLKKYDIADLGALTWIYNSDYGFYVNAWAAASGAKVPAGISAADAYCSELEVLAATVVAAKTNRNGIGIGASLLANDDRFTVAADFKAAMDGVKFVYELATPVELTLTQEQINELIVQMGAARNFGSRTNMLNTWMKLAQGFPVSEEELHMLRPSMTIPDDVVLRPTFEDTSLPIVDPPAAEPEENITESEES